MRIEIAHTDERLTWEGSVSLEVTEEYTRAWRIPFQDVGLYPEGLVTTGKTQAGIRLTFRTDATALGGEVLPWEGNQPLDVYADGRLVESIVLDGKSEFALSGMKDGEKVMELWLPQRGDFALRSFWLEGGKLLEKVEDKRLRWITYGSSITHCKEAASPSVTWPGIVARTLELNHMNMGFGGQCHLDPLIAQIIRDQPADFISICAGINVYGAGSLNVRTFGSHLIGFVRLLREKHVTTPILLMSPIFSCHRETEKNAVGLTLVDMRNEVHTAWEKLVAHGDNHIHYLNGLDVFDATMEPLLGDKLHPTSEGYAKMGLNFLERTRSAFFGK